MKYYSLLLILCCCSFSAAAQTTSRHQDSLINARMLDMKTRFGLSPQQAVQLRELHLRFLKDMEQFNQDALPVAGRRSAFAVIIARQDSALLRILTPAQYEAVKAEQHAREAQNRQRPPHH